MQPAHECLSEDDLLGLVSGRWTPDKACLLLAEVERCAECELMLMEAGRAIHGEASAPALARSIALNTGTLAAKRYRIGRRIGRGGMGDVYEAFDAELEERVALKIISTKLAQDEASLERFRQEVRLARRVVHPNVCRVLEFGRHEGEEQAFYFLTMRLLEGELLSAHLRRRGPLGVHEAIDIVLQLASGIEAIHGENVLHRDIKASNVMLCSSATRKAVTNHHAVLLDFGIARSLDETHPPVTAHRVIGTPDYMAPEQLQGGALSPATDVYALGVLLFELLTGRLPFQAEHSLARAAQRLSLPPPSPSSLVPELTASVDRIVNWCLAKNPEDRPASIRELTAELLRLKEGTLAKAAGSTTKGPSGSRRVKGLLAMGALATFATGALLISTLPPDSPTSARESTHALESTHAPEPSHPPEPTSVLDSASLASKPVTSEPIPVPAAPEKSTEAPRKPELLVRTEAAREQRSRPAPAARSATSRALAPKPRKQATDNHEIVSTLDSVAPPADRCSPPYFYDEQGIRIYRKDCL